MKTAVILFNLGGPDSPDSVEPFLFNLFNDPAIIRLPNPFRWLLAKLISRKRAPQARAIYAQMGGRSPLLPETERQREALEKALASQGDYKVFIAMRYWRPRSEEVVRQVKSFGPDKLILLPLYPHYSTTTTASSIKDWQRAAKKEGLTVPAATLCCYPLHPAFINAHVSLIRGAYDPATPPRLLFSAHGLPKKIVDAGDPYCWQIEQTVRAIVQELAIPELDYAICYQSRVGPLEWVGPSAEEEIARAKEEGKPMLVIPIAFVSEHSETLVELDIEYRALAGNVSYHRVPALGTSAAFIEALADLCHTGAAGSLCSWQKTRFCPQAFTGCPQKGASADAR